MTGYRVSLARPTAIIVLLASPALAGDPVPGIEISLEQIPPGIVRGKAIDGADACLEINGAQIVEREGISYCLVPQAISHNSSRSNNHGSKVSNETGGSGVAKVSK